MALFGFSAVSRMFSGLAGVPERTDALAEETANEMADSMRNELGTYQPGWKGLAIATQTERARLGYTPNDPLLMSGQMQRDIQAWNEGDPSVWFAGIPADAESAEYAAVQELGSLRGVPPRPFVQPIAQDYGQQMGGKVVAEVKDSIGNG